MNKRFVIAFGLSSLLVTSTALAQEATVTADKAVPSFATMDRGDDTSKMGLAASMSFFDEGDATALRFDLYGQYVHKKGYGVYGSLPLMHLSADLGILGGDYSEVAIGNLEVGGLHNIKLDKDTTLTLRGGIALPTADSEQGALAVALNMFPRFTDFVGVMPETTTLRASASITRKQGVAFFRADAGFDIPVSTPDGMDIDPLVRLNVGAGVHAGPVALMGELTTTGTTGDVDEDESRFFHTAALTAALTSNPQLQPTVSVVLPLNSELSDMYNAAVMVGVQGRLP